MALKEENQYKGEKIKIKKANGKAIKEKIIATGLPENEPLDIAEQDMEYLSEEGLKETWD